MPLTHKLSYEQHVLVLFLLVFSSLVLVTFVTFSAPFIPRISFLHWTTASGDTSTRTSFGVFGYNDGGYIRKAAYEYEWAVPINAPLTGVLLLWPVCLGFTFLTVVAIAPLLALGRAGSRPLFLFAMGGSTASLFFAWLLGVFGWSVARRAQAIGGLDAHLGPAHWMGLAAMVCVGTAWVVGWPHYDDPVHRPMPERLPAPVVAPVPTVVQTSQVVQPAPPPPQQTGEYYHYRRTTREYAPKTR